MSKLGLGSHRPNELTGEGRRALRHIKQAADLAQRARDTAAQYEIRPLEAYARAQHAELLLWQGDWIEAEDVATELLDADARVAAVAWRILGTLQARRGRTETRTTLERIWTLAEATDEVQNLDPAASIVAEYLWLSADDAGPWMDRLQEVLDRGLRLDAPWPSGGFAFWMWKLGHLDAIPDSVPDFYRWIMTGEVEIAADFWQAQGAPYDHGLALIHGDSNSQIQAVRIFEQLGASATTNRVRRNVLDAGVSVSRGKSRSTRVHVAGLTARQAEVLELLAEELTNREIADRLFLSRRTVEHHVEAILMRLDVSTGQAAVGEARERGILAAS